MAEEIKLTEILRNPHFSQLTSLLSVPFNSSYWRRYHPHIPFWTITDRLMKLMKNGGLIHERLRQDFIGEFVELITSLVEADPKLFYRPEDMDWFFEVMSGEYPTVVMSMLFAMASSKRTLVTPAQIAEATGTSDSNWRNRAAAGEFVGAFKAGKQWLIPMVSLRAYGIQIEVPENTVDEEEDEDLSREENIHTSDEKLHNN